MEVKDKISEIKDTNRKIAEYDKVFNIMTPEEKQLLLIDLCARLPYRPKGVKPYGLFDPKDITIIGYTGRFVETHNDEIPIEKVRLYLRPLSSMTKEEYEEETSLFGWNTGWEHYDWLNAHHFDYHDLIDQGLALPAPEGMYEYRGI